MAMSASGTYQKHEGWPAGELSRIPTSLYGSTEIYDRELERIFHGPAWHFLCLEREVVQAGDFITTFIGETSIMVLRSNAGEVRAFVNRCSHKGTALCLRQSGNAKKLVCPYHGWAYGQDGSLIGVPFERGVRGHGGMASGFDKSVLGLRRLRVEVESGLVFATLSDDALPFAEFFGEEMIRHVRRTLYRPVTVLGKYSQILSCNWKLHMENTRDSYHPSILHAFFTTFQLNRLTAEGGIFMDARQWHHVSFAKRHTDGKREEYSGGDLQAMKAGFGLRDASLLRQWDEYPDGITNAVQTMFPGFVLLQVSNCLCTRQIIPKGPEETEVAWTFMGLETDNEEQTVMRVKQSNLLGPAGYVSMEDGIIGNLVHRGIKGDEGSVAVVEMGGRDTTPPTSRATEFSVRTFWLAYRAMMGL